MSLADAVAVARAIAVVPLAALILAGAHGPAFLLFVVAALSDALDGWLARRLGTAGRRGALLDPLADKVLVVGTLVALSVAGTGWPVTVVTVCVAAREIAVAVMRVRAYGAGGTSDTGRIAKLKTAGEMAGAALVIVGPRPVQVVGVVLVGLAFLAGLYTLPRYARGSSTPAERSPNLHP